MTARIRIMNNGRMWWLYCDGRVVGFASSYAVARGKVRELEAGAAGCLKTGARLSREVICEA